MHLLSVHLDLFYPSRQSAAARIIFLPHGHDHLTPLIKSHPRPHLLLHQILPELHMTPLPADPLLPWVRSSPRPPPTATASAAWLQPPTLFPPATAAPSLVLHVAITGHKESLLPHPEVLLPLLPHLSSVRAQALGPAACSPPPGQCWVQNHCRMKSGSCLLRALALSWHIPHSLTTDTSACP